MRYYYTLHIFYSAKVKTVWMFCGTFSDKGDNPVNNPNKYYAKGDNRLSRDRQHIITRLPTTDNRKCFENPVRICIF